MKFNVAIFKTGIYIELKTGTELSYCVMQSLCLKMELSIKEKIVKIEAVPGGYEAHAIKTCTYALVSVLNSSYDASEEGVPLKALRERLHKEHANVESRNYPGVESSIISEVVDDFFPL